MTFKSTASARPARWMDQMVGRFGKINTMDEQAQAEMPRYRSHKKVWALKIAEIIPNENPDKSGRTAAASYGAKIVPADDGYAPFEVDAEYVMKHKPVPGGYYVVYADGYKSWSPAQAFEEGYTRL